MKHIFTAEEMRSCDEWSIQEFGVPGIVLMENAARGSVAFLSDVLGGITGKRFVILCGTGNNGGDGFAIARHLINGGAEVLVYNVGPDTASKGDAKTNLDILRHMEKSAEQLKVSLLSDIKDLKAVMQKRPACVIDALLGTGLKTEVKGETAEIIDAVNGAELPVFAIDMPTGINSDDGAVLGAAMRANWTATMGALKRGLLLGQGRIHAGEVRVIDIGMPKMVMDGSSAGVYLLERGDTREFIPKRSFDVHKYKMGRVFVLAGAVGFTGAASMASESALRTGAGLVQLGVPESLNPILEMKLTEVITVPLKETAERSVSLNSYDKITDLVTAANISIIGPGLSRQYETQNLVRKLVQNATRPLLLDADALYALVGHLDVLLTRQAEVVLTPHTGEFSRMINQSAEDVEAKRIELARTFAMEFNVILVLKGAPTVIAEPEGNIYVNPTGNPGMATAGSGDILCGIIAGLYAQGASLIHAACGGVYLHGLAGDRARDTIGEYGLIATDILHHLPETMRDVAAAGEYLS